MTEEPRPDVPRGGVGDTLIAVYEDRETAEGVARSVVQVGVDPSCIRLGVDDDQAESLLAEMQEEVNRAIVAPAVAAVYTKEASKSILVFGVPIVALCTILALPLAILSIGETQLWQRLLVFGALGALTGLAITFVAGPAMGAKRANEPLAAQRGIVVRVDHASPEALAVMASAEPIRLDRIDENAEVMSAEPVTTEELSAGGGILDEIRRNAANPLRENEPGYEPEDPPEGEG
jgi:hypothetical protein